MTPEERAANLYRATCGNPPSTDLIADAIRCAEVSSYARAIADMERGVLGDVLPTDVWPDWVYEARESIRHQRDAVPWLPDLLRILGWQGGGTVHQALRAVARLVHEDQERRRANQS